MGRKVVIDDPLSESKPIPANAKADYFTVNLNGVLFRFHVHPIANQTRSHSHDWINTVARLT